MKVSLITHQWGHPWIDSFGKVFAERGHEYAVNTIGEADVYLHAWSDGSSSPIPGATNIFFWRRFETYSPGWKKINWANVDQIISVNDWVELRIKALLGDGCPPVTTIYNAVDLSRWTFKTRKPGKKIGMVGHVCMKKNYPLALQIMAELPRDYSLHIAGQIQDQCVIDYLDNAARQMQLNLYVYDYIPPNQIDIWWEDKQYCLCTAVSEGNPNNVLEAMAKGIRPVVHTWPGAEHQFNKTTLFSTVKEAVGQILDDKYDSQEYIDHIRANFSLDNFREIVTIAEQLNTARKEPRNG